MSGAAETPLEAFRADHCEAPFHAPPVIGLYFLLGPVLSVSIVYLPPLLKGLGLSGSQIGLSLGIQSIVGMVMPMLWGYVADRTHRPLRTMRVLLALAGVALVLPLCATRRVALIACIPLFGAFFQGVTPIFDGLVMNRAPPQKFMMLRAFYIVGSFCGLSLYGRTLSAAPLELRYAVIFLQACLALSLVGSLGLRDSRAVSVGRRINLRELGALLSNWSLLRWLLPISILLASQGPFDALLAIYAGDLGLPSHTAGDAYTVALFAEALFMFASTRFGWNDAMLQQRRAALTLTVVALLTGVRWWLTAVVHDPVGLVALQGAHALTGGLTFVVLIGLLREVVPAHQRATGQAVMMVWVMLGLMIGQAGGGKIYDHWGAAGAFKAAAGTSVLAALLFAAGMFGRRPDAKGASSDALAAPIAS